MRKIKEVLRLKHEAKLSHEKIAAATGMSKGAVTNTVQRAVQKGLSWPLPADLDESRLEALLYVQAARRLFEEFSLCHADGSFRKRLAAIAKINVLIIDDFAIAPIGPRERNDLLELLDDRVGTRACIVTSQLPVNDWHDYIGDPTLADPILDRLVHRSHRIHLEAKESMRKREAAKETAKAKARAEA